MQRQLSKRHHFVPRFYLKKWLTENEAGFYLHIKNKNNTVTSNLRHPNSIAFEDNLYTLFSDGLFYGQPFSENKNDSVESYLSTIERKANNAYIAMLERGVQALNDSQRNDWAKFISCLFFRMPQSLFKSTEEVMKINSDWYERFKTEFGENETHNRILEKINLTALSKNLVLSRMIENINDVENIRHLRNLKWVLISYHSDSKDTFLTSENPLVVNLGKNLNNKIYFSLALSPTQLFAIMPEENATDENFISHLSMGHNILLMQQSHYLISDKPLGNDGYVKNLKAADLYLAKRSSTLS